MECENEKKSEGENERQIKTNGERVRAECENEEKSEGEKERQRKTNGERVRVE